MGPIPTSRVFRPVTPDSQPACAALRGCSESDLRIHPSAQVILRETAKKQELGLAGPFRERAFFDNMYLKRRTVHQRDKERPIGDGKAGRRSECTMLSETVVNQRPDFPAAVIQFWLRGVLDLLRQVQPHAGPEHLASEVPWSQILVGADDMWKGYRQLHACSEHLPMSIVTFVHPTEKKRVYSQLWGSRLDYLLQYVVQFNRAPPSSHCIISQSAFHGRRPLFRTFCPV